MRITNILLAIAILSLTTPIFAASGKPINLALIADKASGLDKSPLVSMLEVELSQREDIKLLERTAIDRILEEQQLSAAGLLDRNNTIKIGKLLRADALIILSAELPMPEQNSGNKNIETGAIPPGTIRNKAGYSSPSPIPLELNSTTRKSTTNPRPNTNDIIRIRVLEATHGLRVLDYFEQSDEKPSNNSIERIITKIDSVLNKINQPDEKLIPVGILDIHRVQLGEQYRMFERTLPKLLSARLSVEPQIIIMEREDLDILLDEKLMTEGEDTKFWSAAILIDGYVQSNNNQLELHLNLKQAAGENLKSIIVPVEPNEPSNAIVRATPEIIQQLQNSSLSKKWISEREAEAFYQQGQFSLLHGRPHEALILYETAHTLQPENVFYTINLTVLEWRLRDHSYGSTRFIKIGYHFYTDFEFAELVSNMVHQIRDAYEKDIITVTQIYDLCEDLFGLNPSLYFSEGYFTESTSVSSEQIRHMNRKTRKILIETLDKALKEQLLDPRNGPRRNYEQRACLAWLSSDDPYELFENIKNAYNKFIMPPKLGGEINALVRNAIYYYSFRINFMNGLEGTYISEEDDGSDDFYLKNTKDIFLKLWWDYLKEMTKIDDPVVQFNSNLDLCGLSIQLKVNEQEFNNVKYYARKALDILSAQFQNNSRDFSFSPSIPLMRMRKNIGTTLLSSSGIDIWSDVYKPLIETNNAQALALWDPGYSINIKSNGQYDEYKKWLEILNEIEGVLQTHKDNNQIEKSLSRIKEAQAKIRLYYPQLVPNQALLKPNVEMLLKNEDWYIPFEPLSESPAKVIIEADHMDEMLWFSFTSRPQYKHAGRAITNGQINLGLAGINMENRELVSLWQADLSIPFYYSEIMPKVTSMEISNDVTYISIKSTGIVEFPGSMTTGHDYFKDPNLITETNNKPTFGPRSGRLESAFQNRQPVRQNSTIEPNEDSLNKFKRLTAMANQRNARSIQEISNKRMPQTLKNAKVYTHKDGLPSVLISSIARDGNNILVAYGDKNQESGLGIFTPKTGKWESILCSSLQGEEPFNAGHPYLITNMKFIEPDKLLFILNKPSRESTELDKWVGLWKMDIST
ncbi:MAG: hypothetical protein JXA96_14375 [Sedimentisphaerales bacterium]|nr:hypothetical protein [Sedimentisphaerales bacterium]